jgi:hypothetical protein
MKYQLILQWPASSMADYDKMISVEDALMERMSGMHEVDGHDVGLNEVNIFIHTDDPKIAFREASTILDEQEYWSQVRAAYREVTGGKYTILWPEGLPEFSVT